MRIDAHQHFWRYNPAEYGWIAPEMKVLQRDYLPADLSPLLEAEGLQGTVAVQARQTLAETRWLLSLAEEYPWIRGVVGWVDLCSEAVAAQLEELAARPRLVGVRHVLQDEPDDAYMLRPDFVRGLRHLAVYDLAYDLLLYPRHLPAACRLVAQMPEQRFVLDHLAKPSIREGLLEPWAGDIRRLAAYPNVCCKLSGMVTEADWTHWRREEMTPYIEVVLEAFGPQRLMFGSDWPVCTLAAHYEQVYELASAHLDALSLDEREAVLGGTAERLYRLDPCAAPATGAANAT